MRPPEDVIAELDGEGLLEIANEVSGRYGISLERICSKERIRRVSRARHALWYEIYHHPVRPYSYPDIAGIFGVDHTSVLYAVKRFAALLGEAA